MIYESTSSGPTAAAKDKENQAMTNMRKITVTVAILLIGFLGVVSSYLVYPGKPSPSEFMAFDGFIELPRGGSLNVLDYLTLNDQMSRPVPCSKSLWIQVSQPPERYQKCMGPALLTASLYYPKRTSLSSHEARRTRWMCSIHNLFGSLGASRLRMTPMPYSMSRRQSSCM